MGGCPHCNSLESINRDLHDQIGAPLAGLVMEVELGRQLLKNGDSEGAYGVLTDTRDDLVELMAQIRRIISKTDRSQDGNWEVEQALRTMLRRMNRAVKPRLEISLKIDPEVRAVTRRTGWAAFSIAREAVINVLKHSTARNCLVTLEAENGGVRVIVVDDGDVPFPSQHRGGHGLLNMAARAEELGGWCVAGPRPTGGFVVSAYLPHSRNPRRT